MTDNGTDIRGLALEGILRVLEQGAVLNREAQEVLTNYRYLPKKDRAFFSRLLEGTVERALELDYIIDDFSSVPVKKMKPVIRNILREAVYQIRYLDRVPDSAACNQAVRLAEKKGFRNLKGFVNGIVRNISRNPDRPAYPHRAGNPAAFFSVRYSLPLWLVRLWIDEYGEAAVEAMGEAAFAERGITIRCNLTRTAPGLLKSLLENQGIHTVPGRYLPYALEVSGFDRVDRIPGFSEGLFFVQDESSMLVAEAAGLHGRETVIDVCAAPGGKAAHLAEKLAGGGRVSARDLTEAKAALIRENKAREGLANLEVLVQDARVLRPQDQESADVVIADLPCSGLGIIGRKPDIKYKASPGSIRELAALQRSILTVAKEYVKPGGTLLYSTCTVSKVENIENRDWFLKENPDFVPKDLSGLILPAPETLSQGYLQLLPGIHGTDGFFIAAFTRNGRKREKGAG